MKVSVIGAGAVGVSVCQYLLLNGACDNLVLVDLNDEKAKGEILDFGHTTSLTFSRNVKLTHGHYADCAGSRLVIITAGAQIKQGQTRDELAQINARITVEIARELERVAPEAILLFATNPVDLVTRFVIRNTGYPAERVISASIRRSYWRRSNRLALKSFSASKIPTTASPPASTGSCRPFCSTKGRSCPSACGSPGNMASRIAC